MPISGIVLHLSEDLSDDLSENEARFARTRARLADVRGLELGEAAAPDRLPAVLESVTNAAGKAELRALEEIPGVQRVEVVFVGFDEAPDTAETTTGTS